MPTAKPAPAARLPAVPRPLPCPCCGETRPFQEKKYKKVGRKKEFVGFVGLYVGVESATEMGVVCYHCGLRMIRELPERWPPGVFREGRPYRENRERLQRYTLVKVVMAWNRRVK